MNTRYNLVKFKYTLVNVLEVIWQIRTELLKKNTDYQILISLDDRAEQMPEVKGNEGLLYTALINLIENGAKFSPKHTIEVKIKIENHLVIKRKKKLNQQNLVMMKDKKNLMLRNVDVI